MPTSLLRKGVGGNDEVVMSSVTDAVKNFIRHEREASEILGERFTEDFSSHLPPPFIKPFPEHLVIVGGFVWFHSCSTWLGFPFF